MSGSLVNWDTNLATHGTTTWRICFGTFADPYVLTVYNCITFVLVYWATYSQYSISHPVAKYTHYSVEDGIWYEYYWKLISYGAVNTLSLGSKQQSVKEVWGEVL